MEMLLATAYNGIAYALFSGQPLTIIGSTGPVLAFTLVLYRTAQSLSLPFLPLYSWVGIWTSLILLVSSVTSFSNLVNFFTRFTDEIFSLLISVIFLFEACKDLGSLFVNPAVSLTRALLSLVVALATFNTGTHACTRTHCMVMMIDDDDEDDDDDGTAGGGCRAGRSGETKRTNDRTTDRPTDQRTLTTHALD
jgi:hypothetical protein